MDIFIVDDVVVKRSDADHAVTVDGSTKARGGPRLTLLGSSKRPRFLEYTMPSTELNGENVFM